MQKNKNKNYRVSLGQKLSMPEDNGETSLKYWKFKKYKKPTQNSISSEYNFHE